MCWLHQPTHTRAHTPGHTHTHTPRHTHTHTISRVSILFHSLRRLFLAHAASFDFEATEIIFLNFLHPLMVSKGYTDFVQRQWKAWQTLPSMFLLSISGWSDSAMTVCLYEHRDLSYYRSWRLQIWHECACVPYAAANQWLTFWSRFVRDLFKIEVSYFDI